MRNEHLLGSESARDVSSVPVDGRPRAAGYRADGARDASSGTEPTFLFIGTSKAGSTRLYAVLSRLSDIFVAPQVALAKRLGLRRVVGRVKRSPVRAVLRTTFAPDIQRLDQLLDTERRRLWGY